MVFSMPVRLVLSICRPLEKSFYILVELLTIPRLNASCNDRRRVDYATTLTQALLQVLASYSMQRCFPIPMS